jgi:uncharacterized protein DUF1707
VSEPHPSEIRIGDAEREQALQALGDHMSAGRLDIDEYGERTAQVATSKTRGELLELFRDLPDPKPVFGPAPKPAVPVRSARPPAPPDPELSPAAQRWQSRPLIQRLYPALVPLSIMFSLFFFFAVARVWPVFLLPVAIGIIGGSIFGDDWSRDRRAWEREQRDRRRRRERGHW